MTDQVVTAKPKSRRGFAGMSQEKRTEIARKGGSSVPASKRSFSQDRGLAAQAGAKGGAASSGPRNLKNQPVGAENGLTDGHLPDANTSV